MYRSAKTSGGVATTPGSYELNSVKLTMNDGQVIEINRHGSHRPGGHASHISQNEAIALPDFSLWTPVINTL